MPIDWGLLIVTAEKGIAIEISYSDVHSLVTFSWVSYCDNKECFFIFNYVTKEKDHQNTQQSN
jgi:hypothetical protein